MSHLREMFRKQLDFTEFRPKRGTSIRNSATTYITTAQWLVVNFMRQFTANFFGYSWVPNRRVYSFIRLQRNMKKETDTKTDKSI